MTTTAKNRPATPLDNTHSVVRWRALRRQSNVFVPTIAAIAPGLAAATANDQLKKVAKSFLTENARLEGVIAANDVAALMREIHFEEMNARLSEFGRFKLFLAAAQMDEAAYGDAVQKQKLLRREAAIVAAEILDAVAGALHEELAAVALTVEKELVESGTPLWVEEYKSPSYWTRWAAWDDFRFTSAAVREQAVVDSANWLREKRNVDSGLDRTFDILRWALGELDHAPIEV